MVSVLHQIDTNHDELIHDAQANFYGTRLATCSSDNKIKIFELSGKQSRFLTELNGHEGAVWQLDWSHPEFDNLLASCSYDRRVIIWREVEGKWEKIKEYREHDSSVNSVQWAPREFGPMLACASSDGSISILRRTDDEDWESRKVANAHTLGVNAISWAPPISSVSTIYRPTNTNSGTATSGDAAAPLSRPTLVKRFVSGGCDNLVKIWKWSEESEKWIEERQLDGHTDWVRDVAWAPSIGLPKWYVASCSQDRKVIIWINNEGPNGPTDWEPKVLNDFNDIVWHVSWSLMGNILAVSCGENRIKKIVSNLTIQTFTWRLRLARKVFNNLINDPEMDIKAFRGLSGTYNVRANERERAAPRDIECIVQFLDNTQHRFVIDRRSKGQALLDCVFKHLNLVETDYFGLKYLSRESVNTTAQNNIAPFTTLNHSNIGENNSTDSHDIDVGVGHKHRHDQFINNSSILRNGIDKISIKNNNYNKATKTLLNNHSNDPQINISTSQHSPSTDVSLSSSPANNHNIATTSASTATTPSISQSIETVADRIGINETNSIVKSSIAESTGADNCLARHGLESDTKITTKQHRTSESAKTDDSNQSEIALNFREERWLDPSKSIRKQYKAEAPFEFYFRVRFYVSDPSKLAYDTTRNHLYLQLRQDFLNKRLIVPTCSAILLASYTLQSEVGDYKRELDEKYASNCRLLPDENDDIKRKVIELHKQHRSLSSADAEYQFLEHAAKELDCYGVEFYEAKDLHKTNVLIGVSSNGIVVFKDSKRINQFSWAKIIKIMFKKKIFSIQLRRLEGENRNCDSSNNFIEYNILSNQACKSFWEECVAQHSFFRLHQPKSPPKKFFSFLNFGSRFQYNGKTEYQTMEESRKRTFSNFSRSLSKRYARRTLPIGRPSWGESASRHTQSRDNNSDAQSHLSSNSSSSNSNPRSINQTATLAASIRNIKKGLESGDLISQFENLSRRKEDESHEESRLMENIDKNRYQDILPYDSTRVQLIDSMTGDYINASFVDMPVPSGVVNSYIATQGPLSSTCDDFWQMVWEQNSSLIIMVTPLVEAGRVKCHKYWPDEREEVRYGQLLIKNMSEKSKTATINRVIQIVDVKTGEKRSTAQIQYKAWPDHEVPEDCSHFLKLVDRVKKHRTLKPKDPIIVHCSAGIGRTGVLILMETAICFMEAGEPIYPIKILEDMRKQRAMLIQTSSQFRFVAEAICKVYDQKMYKKTKKHRKK